MEQERLMEMLPELERRLQWEKEKRWETERTEHNFDEFSEIGSSFCSDYNINAVDFYRLVNLSNEFRKEGFNYQVKFIKDQVFAQGYADNDNCLPDVIPVRDLLYKTNIFVEKDGHFYNRCKEGNEKAITFPYSIEFAEKNMDAVIEEIHRDLNSAYELRNQHEGEQWKKDGIYAEMISRTVPVAVPESEEFKRIYEEAEREVDAAPSVTISNDNEILGVSTGRKLAVIDAVTTKLLCDTTEYSDLGKDRVKQSVKEYNPKGEEMKGEKPENSDKPNKKSDGRDDL